VFLLKGRNWARWLMLGWLAFHVVVSAFHSLSDCIAHVVLLLVVAYFLLTPPDSKYFHASPSEWRLPVAVNFCREESNSGLASQCVACFSFL
jgi:hypothetical protein